MQRDRLHRLSERYFDRYHDEPDIQRGWLDGRDAIQFLGCGERFGGSVGAEHGDQRYDALQWNAVGYLHHYDYGQGRERRHTDGQRSYRHRYR